MPNGGKKGKNPGGVCISVKYAEKNILVSMDMAAAPKSVTTVNAF